MNGMGNNLIREARRRVALTQSELAALAGTKQSAIARLESGRTAPSFDDVLRYLHLMDLDLDFMLVGRDDSDVGITADMAELSPRERLAHHTTTVRKFGRMRELGANVNHAHVAT